MPLGKPPPAATPPHYRASPPAFEQHTPEYIPIGRGIPREKEKYTHREKEALLWHVRPCTLDLGPPCRKVVEEALL